jgi:hypothetical protein
MATTRTLTVDLGQDDVIAVVAEQIGGELVADEDVIARLSAVAGSIEKVSSAVLDAVRRAAPHRAEVELTFGLAIEAGQLVALLGKAKGEASIRVLLGWESGR